MITYLRTHKWRIAWDVSVCVTAPVWIPGLWLAGTLAQLALDETAREGVK